MILDVRVRVFKAAIEALKVMKDINVTSIFLAGRSMGSRAALQTSTELDTSNDDIVKGVICLAYPLRNPPTAPPRKELLQKAAISTLFMSGTNDSMCNIAELKGYLKDVSVPTKVIALEGGDHSFKAKKNGAFTYAQLKAQQNAHVLEFIESLAGGGKSGGQKRARDDAPVENNDLPTAPAKKKAKTAKK